MIQVKPLKRWNMFVTTMENKGLFQFEIIIKLMSWRFPLHFKTYVFGIYDYYKKLLSAGIDFRYQIQV